MTQIDLNEQIQVAQCLGVFENNSPEWHELRDGHVGGSLVGTIAGLNKWESPYTAWAKFTGKISDEIPDSPAMEWGRRLESVVLAKFQDEHPELDVFDQIGTWQNLERPYQIANPDGLAVEPDGSLSIVEIKTARVADDWENGVPLYYLTQVQWYLSCLGLSKGYVAVLIGGSDYREFLVDADHFQQQADFGLVEQFLDYCDQDQAPDWDGSMSTYETVRKMHPEIRDDEIELGPLGEELMAAIENENAAKSAVNKLKSRVMDKMGFAKRGMVNGQHTFSRQARGTGSPYLVTKRG